MSRAGRPVGQPSSAGAERDAAELEAELLALLGGPHGRAPVAMEDIERMAALCMRDPDEDEEEEEEDGGDEDLEGEEELLAELHEVLADGNSEPPDPPTRTCGAPPVPGDLGAVLAERAQMYRAALGSAKQAGDGPRARRYERGLKTLEGMLTSVRKGKAISEADIPPPVAVGASTPQPPAPQPHTSQPPAPQPPAPQPCVPQPPTSPPRASQPPTPPPRAPQPSPPPPLTSTGHKPPSPSPRPLPPPGSAPPDPDGTTALLRHRQREYRAAALSAKRRGDVGTAAALLRVAKSLDPMVAAAALGRPVAPSSVPPPPPEPGAAQRPESRDGTGDGTRSRDGTGDGTRDGTRTGTRDGTGTGTRTVAGTTDGSGAMDGTAVQPRAEVPVAVHEALQQRMERYRTAAAQARSRGDERKARMHDRIVKQYQDAIRAQRAGKDVDLSELPVPPGFPPLPGAQSPSAEPSIAAVLEAAVRLAGQDEVEDEEEEEAKKQPPAPRPPPTKATASQPKAAPPPPDTKTAPKASSKAQQQLLFLEGRRRQLVQAALRAKRANDVEGAKLLLRRAKAVQPMVEAARAGLPVDISKVPEAPMHDEDFVLGQRRGARVPPEADGRYAELVELLRRQHEMCVTNSKQFTQLGNISEITKLEQLAAECRRSMAVLRQCHARGCPPPKCRYEQRTFNVIKTFPELSSSDMVLSIVKGINLPAPSGVAPNDLDAFVRFEFPYPNAEEAQKDKTAVVKNSDCPEFREHFKLRIDRGHRALKRVLHGKGLKFEVTHRGGLFKADRVVGTAQLKLEALETQCEVRELLEVVDGRRPTGGRLEVMVRIREPLSCHELEARTERWIVLVPTAPIAAPKAPTAPGKDGNNRAALPILSLLSFECERVERKLQSLVHARRAVPPALQQQHHELAGRVHALRSQLRNGGAALHAEYVAQLERHLQLYTDAARRLGTEGNREAAKEALYKRNLVESELQKFRR